MIFFCTGGLSHKKHQNNNFKNNNFENDNFENENNDDIDSDCSDYSVTLDEIPAESVIFSHRSLPQMCKTANRVGKGKKSSLGGEKEKKNKEPKNNENREKIIENGNEENGNGENSENTDFEENHFW